MNTNDNVVNASAISSEEASTRKKQCKTSWYSRLRNETRKNVVKELEERGVVIDKAKKVTPYKKIDPQIKKQYNMKYYSTRKEQIIKQACEHVRNEYAKESSAFVDNKRKLLRKRYHEVVKIHPNKWNVNVFAQDNTCGIKASSLNYQNRRTI